MTLHGGSYNKTRIEDTGATPIRMAIHLKAEGCRTRTGSAIYEPSDDRKEAFFLKNEWEGELVKRRKSRK